MERDYKIDPRVMLAAVMEILAESISEGNSEEFSKMIRLLPISKASVRTTDRLIRSFLYTAMEYGQKDMVKTIFGEWNVVYPKIQEPSLLIVMFTNSYFPDELVSFLLSVFVDLTFEEVVLGLISYEMSDNTTYGCNRATRMFGIQSLELYRRLLCMASVENEEVALYLIDKIKLVNDYADVPAHIVAKSPLPKVSEMTVDENLKTLSQPLSTSDAFNLMMSGASTYSGLTESEIEKSVSVFPVNYESMTSEEKIDFVESSYIDSQRIELAGNEYMTQALGPANAMYGAMGEELKYGGERMLVARARDYVESEGMYYDWFTGACDECYLRIRHRWYAVRQPILTGGWFGCFCSWRCCRRQAFRSTDSEIKLSMITKAESITSSFGILERVPDSERPRDVIRGSFLPLETIPIS